MKKKYYSYIFYFVFHSMSNTDDTVSSLKRVLLCHLNSFDKISNTVIYKCIISHKTDPAHNCICGSKALQMVVKRISKV